jgi:hypothetical protein
MTNSPAKTLQSLNKLQKINLFLWTPDKCMHCSENHLYRRNGTRQTENVARTRTENHGRSINW